MTDRILRIALTPGEPAGIGPDLCLLAGQQARVAELVLIADPELLAARAAQLDLPFRARRFDPAQPARVDKPGEFCIAELPLYTPVQAGRLDVRNARYVLDTLDHAIAGCRSGSFDALVTGPVHKAVINDAGISFSGHTEYLAAATATDQVVMMLASGSLRVALATTHLPLAQVSAAITPRLLTRVLEVLHGELQRRFGIAQPRISVCGLNPHAGENGHLGHEEQDIIIPVLEELRERGMHLTGPLPADTAFTPGRIAASDAFLAMYHDQGLPVLKHIGFGNAVNITLGLPFVRTSVDHGTALELAGTGRVNTGSLQVALDCAIDMCRHG